MYLGSCKTIYSSVLSKFISMELPRLLPIPYQLGAMLESVNVFLWCIIFSIKNIQFTDQCQFWVGLNLSDHRYFACKYDVARNEIGNLEDSIAFLFFALYIKMQNLRRYFRMWKTRHDRRAIMESQIFVFVKHLWHVFNLTKSHSAFYCVHLTPLFSCAASWSVNSCVTWYNGRSISSTRQIEYIRYTLCFVGNRIGIFPSRTRKNWKFSRACFWTGHLAHSGVFSTIIARDNVHAFGCSSIVFCEASPLYLERPKYDVWNERFRCERGLWKCKHHALCRRACRDEFCLSGLYPNLFRR